MRYQSDIKVLGSSSSVLSVLTGVCSCGRGFGVSYGWDGSLDLDSFDGLLTFLFLLLDLDLLRWKQPSAMSLSTSSCGSLGKAESGSLPVWTCCPTGSYPPLSGSSLCIDSVGLSGWLEVLWCSLGEAGGAGLDRCLCRCLPQIGVRRPEGVFFPDGVFLSPVCSVSAMFSLWSQSVKASSGSGDSLNNSSTDGVSAPEGRWNQSAGRVPSFRLIVSLKIDDCLIDNLYKWVFAPGDVLWQLERIDPDLLLLIMVEVGPRITSGCFFFLYFTPHFLHLHGRTYHKNPHIFLMSSFSRIKFT